MRTLIYKRTHSGDPDHEAGVFGNDDCMGSVRGWQFDAVIGVGGIRPWSEGIARKITWIGIGPEIVDPPDDRLRRGPCLRFKHFWYRGEDGPLLSEDNYPSLAHRMYDNIHTRFIINLSSDEQKEVEDILRLAENEQPTGWTWLPRYQRKMPTKILWRIDCRRFSG
jgi:hypothetical protein